MMKKGHFGLLAMSFVLVACASKEKSAEMKRNNPIRSSMAEKMRIEVDQRGVVNVSELLDPEGRATHLPGGTCVKPKKIKKKHRKDWAVRDITCSLQAFETYYMTWPEYKSYVNSTTGKNSGDTHYQYAVNSIALAVRRNKVQDRFMNRSDSLCQDFQRRLGVNLAIQNDSSMGKWMRNSQTRLVGGIGALFLNSDALWAVTNVAQITGLPGYIHDEDEIEKAVTRISIEGISIARQEMKDNINAKRFFIRDHNQNITGPDLSKIYSKAGERISPKTRFVSVDALDFDAPPEYHKATLEVGLTSVAAYTMEQAIGDVIEYHNSCSVSLGLEYSARALHEMKNKRDEKKAYSGHAQ